MRPRFVVLWICFIFLFAFFHVVWVINLRKKTLNVNVIKQKCKTVVNHIVKNENRKPDSGFQLMSCGFLPRPNISGLLSQNKCLIRYKFLLLPCALILVSRIKRPNEHSFHKSLWLVFQLMWLRLNYLFMKSETINVIQWSSIDYFLRLSGVRWGLFNDSIQFDCRFKLIILIKKQYLLKAFYVFSLRCVRNAPAPTMWRLI